MAEATPAVVVLAGGSNRRFWPLRAKSLLPFCGRSLLERHIEGFIAAGCRRFVVVANAETADAIRRLVAPLPAEVTVTVQAEPRGMGDAVLTAAAAAPELERSAFVVSQAHDVVDPSLYGRFLAAARTTGGDGLLTGQRVREYFPGAYLTLAGERVTGLVEKPPPGAEPSDVVSLVLHLHRRPAELLAAIRAAYADPTPADDHYERAIAALLPHRTYQVVRYDGPWRPVKYPWHVLGVMDLLLAGLPPMPDPPEGVIGPVVLEEGVRILPGGRVVGPAWIGAGTLIGTGALVRGSMLGRHVEVGYGCEVARSYVADGAVFHHCYIGDSVIDRNVSMGFGTVTGNFPFYPSPVRSSAEGVRLATGMEKLGAVVGAESRTGIGVLLNPGVKVGARTFIGPGVVVTRDVPDGRLLLVRQEIRDEPNPFR
jgi:NDP-sugar pyrophosphorylase family protein